jgi:hypothetical protein
VDGALILSAIILFVGAFLAAKSWSTGGADLERVAESQAVADRTAASAQATALEGPPPPDLEGLSPPEQPLPEPATSAADLVGPLSVILSRLMKFPTTGNLVLDELLVVLRGSAKGAADEAVDGVVHAVRYGDRAKLVAVLGGAVLFGWLLARHRADHVQSN